MTRARSFSVDTPPPETPVSLHLDSPVIETETNAPNEPVNLDRVEPTLPFASVTVTPTVPSLLPESETGCPQHHPSGQVGRHDFKALYVFGVPHAGMETQIKETFEKFGKVAGVEYMSYRGHGLLACFVNFEDERGTKETLDALVSSWRRAALNLVVHNIHRTVVNISILKASNSKPGTKNAIRVRVESAGTEEAATSTSVTQLRNLVTTRLRFPNVEPS